MPSIDYSLRSLLSRAFPQLHRRVNINLECDYPDAIAPNDYKTLYCREGIGARVVSIYPEHCWEEDPIVLEDDDEDVTTAFETALEELIDRTSLWSYLEQLDIESGIGRYGVMLLGTDDGDDLTKPLTKATDILYLRVFDESVCGVASTIEDATNPLYKWPETYTIQTTAKESIVVHHSRVIHISDRPGEPFAASRMEGVYNRLLDLRKMFGGSAEMLWQAGFSGMSFEPAKLGDDMVYELDGAEIKKAVEAYRSGLQRYIAVEGAVPKVLQTTVADPSNHIESQLKAIALIKGVPYRIFMGTEEAQLAGAQDNSAWNKRIRRRQNRHVSPFIIKKTLRRFIELGILPEPKQMIVKWVDRESITDDQKADIGVKRTQAIAAYVTGGVAQAVPLFEFLTLFLGLDREEASGIVDKIDEELLLISGDMQDPNDPNADEDEDPEDDVDPKDSKAKTDPKSKVPKGLR